MANSTDSDKQWYKNACGTLELSNFKNCIVLIVIIWLVTSTVLYIRQNRTLQTDVHRLDLRFCGLLSIQPQNCLNAKFTVNSKMYKSVGIREVDKQHNVSSQRKICSNNILTGNHRKKGVQNFQIVENLDTSNGW